MIDFAETKDIEQIKKLWRGVFGDSDAEIESYLLSYLGCVLLYTEKRVVKGMLSMLPVAIGEKRGRYIYAVATEPEARGRGISTKLIQYANDYILGNGEYFSILVPAEKSLFEFYKKRGYASVSAVKRFEFDNMGFGDVSLEVKKISPEKLFKLRRSYFKKTGFIEWGVRELEYIWKIYGGNFFEIKGKDGSAFAVCSFHGGMLDVKELCCEGLEPEECISALNRTFNAPHCRAALPDKHSAPSAMIYPDEYADCYFNLAMD